MTDTTRLRGLAEAATGGPWRWYEFSTFSCMARDVGDVDDSLDLVIVFDDGSVYGEYDTCVTAPDAAYIAAMHPAQTIALLDELDRLRAAVAFARKSLCEDGYGVSNDIIQALDATLADGP